MVGLEHVPRPTKTYHASPYPAIAPTRPELNLKGKTVLITGGATGIGSYITKAFATAGASHIALVARREQVMLETKQAIESEFPNTKVSVHPASIDDNVRINEIVKQLGIIDILVLNAGTMPNLATSLETNQDEFLQAFKTNVLGPANLMKAFVDLEPRKADAERTIIYVSSAGAHLPITMPGTSAYNATKAAAAVLMGGAHDEYASRGIRVFTIHPAVTYTPMAAEIMGMKEDSFEFDSIDIAGAYCVWLCSPEAEFLRGRFSWSNWDVTELAAKKELIEKDPTLLRLSLNQVQLVA